ncbi:MAG: dicarboxylate/amino acid:cation symporter [Spirochaetaceae bacterium]|nr:dicarboxylate/amino acid:cation symporter [Spirochaetaceae bacterium]
MKLGTIGIRTAIAVVAATLVALFAPQNTLFLTIAEAGRYLSLQFGRYLLYPFLFFNMAIAVTQLRRQRKLLKVIVIMLVLLVSFNAIMAALGVLLAVALPLRRVPIVFEQEVAGSFSLQPELLAQLLPSNLFTAFSGYSLAPILLVAFFIGLGMAYDREVAEPSYNFFDSLGRICYRIAFYYVYFSFIPVFFFTLSLINLIRTTHDLALYQSVLTLTMVSAAVIILILYAVIYRLFARKKGLGIRYLRGAPASLAFAAATAQPLLAGLHYSYLSHKNQGISRELGAFVAPIMAIFLRAGSSLISGVVIIAVLRSYSSLDLTAAQVWLTMVSVFMASFLVVPYDATFLHNFLQLAYGLYGRTVGSTLGAFEPIIPLLSHLAAVLDLAALILLLRIMASLTGFERFKASPSFT